MKYSDTDNSISFDYEKPELFGFVGDPRIVKGESSNNGAYENGGEIGSDEEGDF